MNISEQWLRSWVNPLLTTEQLAETLTMSGLEVESHHSVAPLFSGVIVAEVLSTIAHPNADRLRLCKVNIKNIEEPLSIVCGAANVRPGLKVALAMIGAKLPGDFEIKKGKIRGEESWGMLCSAKELGLAQESDGILELPTDAPVGEDFRQYWQLNDSIFEISLTPNRGDCLSVRGLAREINVLTQSPLNEPSIQTCNKPENSLAKSIIKEPQACPCYIGLTISNIKNDAKTPLWMKLRLERSGIRTINPVVDVTQYVMLELGQPMHAFDSDKLQGSIEVRFAKDGELITLLNQQEVVLKSDTLVIADSAKVLAIAGVMGSIDSSVSEKTQHIFLESAYFKPEVIAGKARQYGLSTDASHRFERGIDPNFQNQALERAVQLLIDIVGGEVGGQVEAVFEKELPQPRHILLSHEKLERYLAMTFSVEQLQGFFQRLGFRYQFKEGYWQIDPPLYRHDLQLDVDIIEEITRLTGYQHLPVHLPQLRYCAQKNVDNQTSLETLRSVLVQLGYHEAITYSFVDPVQQHLLHPHSKAYELKNPISSDLAVMRVSLWPGLLRAVVHNQNRQQQRVRLFEIGKVFVEKESLEQITKLAGVATSLALPEQWSVSKRELDFFDIKGDVEAFIATTMQAEYFDFRVAEHSALHPGQSAQIFYQNKEIGWIGAVHPGIQKELDCVSPLFIFELDLTPLLVKKNPVFKNFSKYPANRRDIALVINRNISAQYLLEYIQKNASNHLVDFTIFDVYEGSQLGENLKSVGISLMLQSSLKTLQDEEIQNEVEQLVEKLKQEFSAELRDS